MSAENKARNIVFLCYSRYVIMIAYIMKKVYFSNDRCTLVISDAIANENGIIEHISKTGLWDEVYCLPEKGLAPKKIHEQVEKFVHGRTIDVFFTSHIMRCASHYFVHILKNNTEINMYDEGIISLDISEGYRYWTNRVNMTGWAAFAFEKISKYYVLFPEITKSFYDVEIVGIDIGQVVGQLEFVEELNKLFAYQYEPIKRPYIIIDADVALQGQVTQVYENFCAQNIVKVLGEDNCIVKIKPSEDPLLIKGKYGDSKVQYIANGSVPFEVMYLNYIVRGDIPQYIVAFPTTLIWNLALINEKLNIENLKIISIAKIMSNFYYVPGEAENMMNKIQDYQQSLKGTGKIVIPSGWDEIVGLLKGEEARKNFVDEEREWVIREYKTTTYTKETEKDLLLRKNKLLHCFVEKEKTKERIAQHLNAKGIESIILYGSGEVANLLYELLEPENRCFVVKTQCKKDERFRDLGVISVEEFAKRECDDAAILITALGKEKEILEILNQYSIANRILVLEDIINFND